MKQLKHALRLSAVLLLVFAQALGAKSLKIERMGKVLDSSGICSLQPRLQTRWTPVIEETLLSEGDWLRTGPRGANAVQVRLADQTKLILGPGGLIELVDRNNVKLVRGDIEIVAAEGSRLTVHLPDKTKRKIAGTQILRVKDGTVTQLENEPSWLKYFKGTIVSEPMGSLLANVEGRNLPLTLGYHKVTVDIRDQIARTTIEESFMNHTAGRLEGIFHFPLPQDASISGFGMWIGDELVEADVVEKQRAREIYETILRERRDPGLLEWSGGNIFKARVYPIFAHSEKRIKITYTQVLPMEGGSYRYSYALQSEMLKQFPLRELAVNVRIHSVAPLEDVICSTHATRLNKTEHSAQVEFSAEEYTPTRDFELEIKIKPDDKGVTVVPHRRGDDGYFLMLVTPPDIGERTRAVITDGESLDLVVVADTSASMDRAQRKAQEEFIATLLGSLGEKDRFRLAAVDVGCAWYDAAGQGSGQDERLIPTEENIEAALRFLAARSSLGWTDLESTFSDIFKHVGKSTDVIYTGDAIGTSGDADPVAIAGKLKRLYGGKGSIHAVATGNSYEPGIMKTLAGLGGGSWRRIEGENAAQATALELLMELTRPGVRDMEIEFQGVRTARVYPEELPNLPAGKQQIVIGRYLPEGEDQTGRVIVTGTQDGKPIRFEAPIVLKNAESGNSFIPRLWARMHLDSLLEEGTSPAIKDDIIALSEEYRIMTPYTSFLVLESDADRERFGVKRRFGMRDAEKFFAEGRDAATYELRQQYMKLAGKWRQDMRRRMLHELLALGRTSMATPEPYPVFGKGSGGSEEYRGLVHATRSHLKGGTRAGSLAPMVVDMISGYASDAAPEDIAYDINGDFTDEDFFGVGGNGMTVGESEEEPADGRWGDSDMAMEPMAEEIAFDMEMPAAEMSLSLDKSGRLEAQQEWAPMEYGRRDNRWNYFGTHGADTKNRIVAFGCFPPPPIWQFSWLNELFPPLPSVSQKATPPAQNTPVWSEEALALARSLLRQDELDAMTDGGLEITVSMKRWDIQERQVNWRSTLTSLYSPRLWLHTTRADGQQTIIEWCDDTYRGISAPCFQLGRQRKAEESDYALQLGGSAAYNDHSLKSLAETYRGYEPTVKPVGSSKKLLVLRYPGNSSYEQHFLIDTRRNVLLKYESWSSGKMTARTTFDDFIEVAGCRWARKVSQINADGEIVSTTTISVKMRDEGKFSASIRAALPATKGAILLDEPLKTVLEARQAVHDGTATFSDHAAIVTHYAQYQRWDKVMEAWEDARPLVKDHPGEMWLDDAVLELSRRYEETRERVVARSTWLVEKDRTDEYYLAGFVTRKVNRFAHANERIEVAERLRPIYARQPERLNAMKSLRVSYAGLLQQAGRSDDAIAAWEKLAKEYRKDINIQTQYFSSLADRGRVDEGLEWIEGLLRKKGHWKQTEKDNVRNGVSYRLQNAVPTKRWLAFLEEWIGEDTANQTAYQHYLTALLRAHQTEKTERLVKTWLAEGIEYEQRGRKDDMEQAVMARMQAGLQVALGQGRQSNTVDRKWHKPLAEVVKAMYCSETRPYMANQVMQHYSFRQLDEARDLRGYFAGVLVTDADKPAPQQIQQIVNWIRCNDPEVDDATWGRIAARLTERWENEKDENARHRLSQPLVQILRRHIGTEELLAFLRRQLNEGPKGYCDAYASQLFYELINQPWKIEHEDEAFALLPRLTSAETDEARLNVLVPALLSAVDGFLRSREGAAMDAVSEKEDLSRKEMKALQNEKKTEAQEAMVARLQKEETKQEECLKPWLTIERLYLQVKLRQDVGRIAEECWDLLDAKPRVAEEMTPLEAVLVERSMTTLACLAARGKADPALVKRVVWYIDEGIAVNPDTPYWKYQKQRLLVAGDEPEQLAGALRSWIRPGKVDPAWRLSLGYLMAEQDRVDEAIEQFELLEKIDGLSAAEYKCLSGWYLIKDEKEKHEAAAIRELMMMDEHTLSRRLDIMLQPWQREQGDVPEELDPQAIRIFVALFRKSRYPNHYMWQLGRFYRQTRDFRLPQCLAEGILGHTTQQVYPFVQNLDSVLDEVRDEATVDTIVEHIGTVRTRAETDVDRRALDLLELQGERRAAEVSNQPGPHVEAALKAMRRAFRGKRHTGERRLMADFLARLGRIDREPLKREQIRQLVELSKYEGLSPEDRLYISRRLAETLWGYGEREQSVDMLESALAEYRVASGGVLPNTANGAVSVFIGYLENMKQFTRGERYLMKELERPEGLQQKFWMTQRLMELYISTVRNNGQVSLGSGQVLYDAVFPEFVEQLGSDDHGHRQRTVGLVCNLVRAAHSRKLGLTGLRAFVFETFPEFLEKETNEYSYHSHISTLAQTLRDVGGPAMALEFLIVSVEGEPEWVRMSNQSGWARHNYQLGRCRAESKNIAHLEPRLLKIVKDELRRDLTYHRGYHRSIYHKDYSYFWREKEKDFLAVAEAVLLEREQSCAASKYIAEYMFDGLGRKARAIEVLFHVYNREKLDEAGRAQLVRHLHDVERFRESIPILTGLVKERPDAVQYRTQLMWAYFKTGDTEKLTQTLADADAHFHEKGMWHEYVIASLASMSLETELYRKAIEYYDEVIPLHQRTHARRGIGNGTLSHYYGRLSSAHIALGQTAEAVGAASGAIVSWGGGHYNRSQAISSLRNVLNKAPDLEAYVAQLDRQAAEDGLENPIVRKELGRIYLDRKNYREAIRNLELAIEAQPNDGDTHKAIVQAYDSLGDPQGATAQLLSSVELSRRNIELYKDLGDRYARLGDPGESERAYLSIVEMLPNESESHTMLAQLRQQQDRWDEAIHHWKQVIRVRTIEPTGYLRLAEAQIHRKQWDDARATLKILRSKDWPPRFGDVDRQADDLSRRIPQ